MMSQDEIEDLKLRLEPLTVLELIDYSKSHPKSSGSYIRDACPVHRGDDPNLAINIENGSWYCHSHGCKGGDLIELYKQAKSVNFVTACQELAQYVGMPLRNLRESNATKELKSTNRQSNKLEKKEKKQAEWRKEAERGWKEAKEGQGHPYFSLKGLPSLPGIRYGKNQHGNFSIVVPFTDVEGRLQCIQYINNEGEEGKRFRKGTSPEEAFFSLGSVLEAEAVCLTEGLATAASIWIAQNKTIPTLSCGPSNNISKVVKALKDKFSSLKLIICLDADAAGDKCAQEISELGLDGILFRRPNFEGLELSEKSSAKDFNDLYLMRGHEETQKQLEIDYRPATLPLQSRELLIKYYRDKPCGLRVGFKLQEAEEFEIPLAALTIFAAPTKHGKTTALVNLALGALEHNANCGVLFVTLEERKEPIFIRCVNAYAEIELSKNNKKSIETFYKTYDTEESSQKRDKDFSEFKLREEEFFDRFINAARLHIFDRDDFEGIDDVSKLTQLIWNVKKNHPEVHIVVVDYIQLIRSESFGLGKSRQEELKQVCLALKNLANATGLSLVMAAQFNREVINKNEMHSCKIGEAGDIERHASLVVGMWNCTKPQVCRQNQIQSLSPMANTIIFKFLENRYGPSGMEFVVPFNGNTGKIQFDRTSMTDKTASPTKAKKKESYNEKDTNGYWED